MPPLYEVLFLFSAPQGYLAEIKRLDLPADMPKARTCQWLWIQSATVTTLQFLDLATSSRQHRSFKEASLWFDDAGGELLWHKGPTEQLVTETSKTRPAPLLQLVNSHLS